LPRSLERKRPRVSSEKEAAARNFVGYRARSLPSPDLSWFGVHVAENACHNPVSDQRVAEVAVVAAVAAIHNQSARVHIFRPDNRRVRPRTWNPRDEWAVSVSSPSSDNQRE